MSRRLELGLALALALAVAVAFVAGSRGASAPPLDFRTSSLVSGPQGSRAVYDVLARLRVPVERRRSALFDFARDTTHRAPPAVLLVLDPPRGLYPAELAQVMRFVRSGGRVVVAGSGGGITRCVGWRTNNEEVFFPRDSFRVIAPSRSLTLPPVADFLKPRRDDGAAESRLRVRAGQLEEGECETVPAPAEDTLLHLTDGRPAVLRLHYQGGGSVTLVADPGYFRNRVWRSTDVPYFVAPLLMPARRGSVVWDEYHQGFGRGRSMAAVLLGWLAGTPGGWAILQLVAVLLAGLAVTAVRFGPPRRAVATRRRSPLEHLEALAAGLESAAGVDTAVALTVSGLRRRLGRTGALRPDEQRSWLAALELALPSAAGRDAVRRLQRLITQPGGPERALAAAQAAEDVWEELRPPTPRAAS
ncbi:MAG: hypothetical protein DMD55_05225 [Gemmatimonadetes bacterium]|nr:MAG: hypothetical protein DMD55_05225 [Gemmatimonadota bacterium]